ncbi:MAG TPA: hypothetical protein VF712_01115 [Thermoleophilaceae bacterium]
MIVIELSNRRYDRDSRRVVTEPAARIEVERGRLEVVEGNRDWELIKETVLNHPDDRTRNLTFEDDPELWALHLHEAFRTGDTVIEAKGVEAPADAAAARSAVAASPGAR